MYYRCVVTHWQAGRALENKLVNPYRALFAAPGTRGFAVAGLLARMALPMTGIGIITMLSQLRASYALAGAVSATFVLTYALLSPQTSRLVDRYGQSRVLPVTTMISVIGMLILLAASRWHAPDGILFAGALLAGFMPSISAMLRARWTAIYRGRAQLSAAYSLETVLDEATYIVGPALSVGLSVAAFPQAGPLAALGLLVLGVWALTAQRGTEPQVQLRPNGTGGAGSVIRLANVRLLTLLMVAMGIIVGTVDIVSVALSEQLGQPAAASLVLAAYAVGSFLAGLVFGAMRLRTPLHRLLLLGGLATAITTLPLMLAGSIPTLATMVLVAGLFFAPTMIVAMTLVERLVPEHQLTEGMTWLLAGLNVGVALGAVASGQIVDDAAAQAGFAVALGAGVLVLLLALLGYLRLRASDLSLSVTEAA
jgi:MFS family permease